MLRLTLGAVAMCLLIGCASLTTTIVEPHTQSALPGRQSAGFDQGLAELGVRSATTPARGGNRMSYRDVPPADYHIDYRFRRIEGGMSIRFDVATKEAPVSVPRRGTIVFLHGWGDDHRTMLPWALALAKHGYRGIVPDLRNHGASDRAPAGFGTREADDIVDLLASLRARDDLTQPLILFGVSYGGAAAVFAADDLQANVQAVIAMEPLVNAGGAVRSAVASVRDGTPTTWRGRFARFFASRRYGSAAVDRAIAAASERLALDLDAVDIGPSLRDGGPCTLLIQGGADRFLGPERARALADAPRVRYAELPVENHFSLPARIDLLAEPLAAWLATADHCVPFAVPADAEPTNTTAR